MPVRRYRLGTGDGSVNASIASFDSFTAPRAGKLVGVLISVNPDSITDNVRVTVSVSRSAVNDTRTSASYSGAQTDTLGELTVTGNFVTSGLAQESHQIFIPCDEAIEIGTKIHAHNYQVGTAVIYAHILLYIRE